MSVTLFSVTPVGPIAPESLPPWPASIVMTRPFSPVISSIWRSVSDFSSSVFAGVSSWRSTGFVVGFVSGFVSGFVVGFVAGSVAGFVLGGVFTSGSFTVAPLLSGPRLPKSITTRPGTGPPLSVNTLTLFLPTFVSTTTRTVFLSNCATRTFETKRLPTIVSFLTFGESHAPLISATTRVGFDSVIVWMDTAFVASTTMRVLSLPSPTRTPVTSAMLDKSAASVRPGTTQRASKSSTAIHRKQFLISRDLPRFA